MRQAALARVPSNSNRENATAPHFDHIARPYRWLEYLSFGPYLQRTRTHWLPLVRDCRSALVLGDGDGRFTASLLKANPGIHVHAADLSATMLHLLSARGTASGTGRLSTEAADLRNWAPPAEARYDLIATHFFLDCLTTAEAAGLAQRLQPALAPESLWLVSEFSVPGTRYGRWIARPLVAALYRTFALLTGLAIRKLPDHGTALRQSGWQLGREHHRLGGLLLSQLWRRSEAALQAEPAGLSENSTCPTTDIFAIRRKVHSNHPRTPAR